MPASEIDLCTAADVAEDLGIDSSATVQRVVTAASRAIAAFCGRTFQRGTDIVEYPASYPRRFLLLDRAPIVSITSITEHGSTVDAADYQCIGKNAEAGIVYRVNGFWLSTELYEQRVTRQVTGSEGRSGDTGITVTYTAGYVTPGQAALDAALTVTLPEDLQEAAIQTAVSMYRARGVDQNIASESIGDWSVSYFAEKARAGSVIPGSAQSLLARHVRLVVG